MLWRRLRDGGQLIHRSSWKDNSANFRFTEFSEVDQEFIGNSSPLASVVAFINTVF
jgi:hypothetical protein